MNTPVCVVLAALASGAAAQWYNGDPDNVNGQAAEFNTIVSDAFVFENFNHGGGSFYSGFGNFYISTNVQGCIYELRSGVSNGFGGTRIAGGDVGDRWRLVRNHVDGHGYLGYTLHMWLPGPGFNLPAGEYMLAISPIGDGTGRAFVQTTSGEDSWGTPINDYRNWFYSTYFAANYSENQLGAAGYSYGLGWPAPPSSLAILAFAALASRRRR